MTNVCVCVCGQVSRFQPHHLLPLIARNINFSFVFFFYLQANTHKNPIYNSGSAFTAPQLFQASSYAAMSQDEISGAVQDLLKSNNSRVESVRLLPQHNRSFWENNDNMGGRLDRIFTMSRIQESILNMYMNQVECASAVKLWIGSAPNTSTPAYFISMREDIYFFHPPSLSDLTTNYLNTNSCSLVVKDCLAWGGVSMRFQLYHFQFGVKVLAERLSFYRSLYSRSWSASIDRGKKQMDWSCFNMPDKWKYHILGLSWDDNSTFPNNPECFEMLQNLASGLKICQVPIAELPAAPARIISGSKFCFIDEEIQDFQGHACYPASDEAFVKNSSCRHAHAGRLLLR